MSAKERVCDVGCGKMHELAICFDKAGFNANDIQDIIDSKDNKKAQAMFAAITSKISDVPPIPGKFREFINLGLIMVWDDYMPETCLSMFSRGHHEKFGSYNDTITDKHFSHPGRVLKPGDKLRVRVIEQTEAITTSQECMAFLDQQEGNVYLGAQGLAIVFERMADLLPKNKEYTSFDRDENLWQPSGGHRRLPIIRVSHDGEFDLDLKDFKDTRGRSNVFFSFSEVTK